MNKYLSKSNFIKGLQCEKSLYLHKFKPELSDPITEQQKVVFERGSQVGVLAQQLFPGGVDASPKDNTNYFESFQYTQSLINNGSEIIYEAGFYIDNVMCFVDILVKEDTGWHAYEVKSSTSISNTYVIDAALQYYILQKSGLQILNISIIHINNNYIRNGDIDLKSLFNSVLVTEDVLSYRDYIKKKLIDLHDVLDNELEPNIDIGSHCNEPYDCNFRGYCWRHIPNYSIFNLSRITKKNKWNLYNKGFVDLTQIPVDTPLSNNQKIEVDSYINKTNLIHKSKIREFINSLSDIRYYLDFETYQSAIPPFSLLKPYQQIPFQYSIHLENDNKIHHYEFLSQSSLYDSREDFIKSLISHIGLEGDIIVYNMSFEKSRLKELICDFPEYNIPLQSIIDRMKDLMIPFKEKWYYTPSMKGSYSIKSVLPSLVPSLSYDKLSINNGALASAEFIKSHKITDSEKTKSIRNNLLKYCELDTFALVKIVDFLKSI